MADSDQVGRSFSEQSAVSCRTCHLRQYNEWSRSSHKTSFSNPIYKKGLRSENNKRCLDCHLPLKIQRENLNSDRFDFRDEGVTCVSCHTAHESQTNRLQSANLCSRCHQFNFLRTDIAAQNTYKEWLSYQQQGGTKRCQDCHMSKSSHEFRVNKNEQPMRKALKISGQYLDDEQYQLTLYNIGAGHSIPTGDIFRHIQIQIVRRGQPVTLFQIGRNPFVALKDRKITWKNDNSIKPGERRQFLIPTQGVSEIRLVYFREAMWAGPDYFFSPLKQDIFFAKKITRPTSSQTH